MNIVQLTGGLGNQMFQYAFYIAKRKYDNHVIITDYSIRHDIYHSGCPDVESTNNIINIKLQLC